MKQKPQTAWAIVDPSGEILPWTIDRTRRESIDRIDWVMGDPWQKLRDKYGYRAARVEIRVIEQEDKTDV